MVPHKVVWTYSLTFPKDHDWTALPAAESYRRMHALLQAAFQTIGIETTLADCCRRPKPGECFEGHELHDLLWHGKKIAGAAQRRNRFGLLIQGSVQPQGDWPHHNWIDALAGYYSLLYALPKARANELVATKYSLNSHNRKL